MDNFDVRLERAKQFCISRAGSGNRESTREFCSCIEHPDGEKLIAELVRGSHANQKLAAGIRLLFTPESLIEIADRFGVDALPVSGELDDAIDVRCADFADQTVDSSGPTP